MTQEDKLKKEIEKKVQNGDFYRWHADMECDVINKDNLVNYIEQREKANDKKCKQKWKKKIEKICKQKDKMWRLWIDRLRID